MEEENSDLSQKMKQKKKLCQEKRNRRDRTQIKNDLIESELEDPECSIAEFFSSPRGKSKVS